MSTGSNTAMAEPAAVHDHTVHAESSSTETKPTGLHSPPATDSNNTHKSDGSDSELSDVDDITPVDPRYPGTSAEIPDAPEAEPLSPIDSGDDIGDIKPEFVSNGVPVFRPTMAQFRDFKRFVRCRDSFSSGTILANARPHGRWAK